MTNLPIEKGNFRHLTLEEIDLLEKTHNRCDNWDKIFVTGVFDPALVKNCHFIGKNYIAELSAKELSFNNIHLQTGFYNSTIRDCFFEQNVAIHNVSYISNYMVAEESLLFNVNDISCSENSSFGNGFNQDKRNWINVANENGGRRILPFEGILPADAWLWSGFRSDMTLLNRLEELTDKLKANNALSYGLIGPKCRIKNVKSIADSKIGAYCIIDGSSRISNCTVCSSAIEPSLLADNVELADGIVGYGNKLLSAAKCFHFITGRNVKIELGARIVHSFVGSNSTIACCEVLNNLIFPFHEQHHNNSFLIASTVMGQSNIAAGATIGSNHNSRAADGEIKAGRGFWPGLETDFKHNSFFASFSLIAKGSYGTELDVRLPFSLVSKDKTGNLQIYPGFWIRYNMYALARNSWKYKARDNRKIKDQNIETDFLAGDTLFEIITAITLLEQAIKNSGHDLAQQDLSHFKIKDLTDVYLAGMAPKENVRVLKPLQAIWVYKNLIHYTAAKEIVKAFTEKEVDISTLFRDIPDIQSWYNFGGQPVSKGETEKLIDDIKQHRIDSWQDVHKRYYDLWQIYPEQKLKFALACWLKIREEQQKIKTHEIKQLIEQAIEFNSTLQNWILEARKKDYDNPFRQSTYSNMEEMIAVLGSLENDTFIKLMNRNHKDFKQQALTIISKL